MPFPFKNETYRSVVMANTLVLNLLTGTLSTFDVYESIEQDESYMYTVADQTFVWENNTRCGPMCFCISVIEAELGLLVK